MAVHFKFSSNVDVYLKAMRAATFDAGEEIKETAVEAIQDKILYGYHEPHGKDGHTEIVDTGRLFDGIDANARRVSQNIVQVEAGSTDAPYAIYVHNGTRKLHGRPFIRDSLNEKTGEFAKIWEQKLKG